MLSAIMYLRRLAGDPLLISLLKDLFSALERIVDGEERRKVARDFLRQAEIKAEVLAFDKEMIEEDKKP